MQLVDVVLNGFYLEFLPAQSVSISNSFQQQWGLCKYVIVHTILPPSPVIWRIELGGNPKWLPLNSGYHDVMHTSPIALVLMMGPDGRFLLAPYRFLFFFFILNASSSNQGGFSAHFAQCSYAPESSMDCMDADRLNLLKERTTGRGTAVGFNCRKDKKNTTSFHQNATKSRHDTFS